MADTWEISYGRTRKHMRSLFFVNPSLGIMLLTTGLQKDISMYYHPRSTRCHPVANARSWASATTYSIRPMSTTYSTQMPYSDLMFLDCWTRNIDFHPIPWFPCSTHVGPNFNMHLICPFATMKGDEHTHFWAPIMSARSDNCKSSASMCCDHDGWKIKYA